MKMLHIILEKVNLTGVVTGQSVYSRVRKGLEDIRNGKFNET